MGDVSNISAAAHVIQLAVALVAIVLVASAFGQPALPAGAVRVSFGTAVRTRNAAGTESCRITKPLSSPVIFDRPTEITYTVELEPKGVKSAQAQLVAPAAQALAAVPCNVFTLVTGGFSQTQVGNTVSRADRKPFLPGVYSVHLTIDGRSADVAFTIK